MHDYDVIVIGAGVTGSATARELSRYELRACVIEKGDDVCSGTSKANSGVIHSGFDPKPGSMKAKMNVMGNKMIWKWAQELDFPVKKNGAIVVCTEQSDLPILDELLEQAKVNGVEGVRIMNREQAMDFEPNLTDKTLAALYTPTGGVICPFNFTIAMAENANVNGVEFKLETEVKSIEKLSDGYRVVTNQGSFTTKAVVNAAGVYADVMHNMVSEDKLHITARKGEYLLLDKKLGGLFQTSVFTVPGKMGKGILTAPTIHGNLYVGPSATDVEDKESTNTTGQILDLLKEKALTHHLTKADISLGMVITSFAGLRAHEDRGDFVIGEAADAPNFFDAAGIESPGLTSSPAIGHTIAEMIADKLSLKKKDNFIERRRGVVRTEGLSDGELAALIAKDANYGNVICRCERITEAEIIDAIHRPLGARSMDSVKRRTRAGMGRCQGGFCTPRVMEILARELDIPMTQITKKGGKSFLVAGKNKEL